MNDTDRKNRNNQKIAELYPLFGSRIRAIIDTLEVDNIRPRIQTAWRSIEDQRKAYETGHSKLLYGFHNVTNQNGTPEALAVDLLDDDYPLNPGKPYLLRLVAAAEQHGLETGIRWGVPERLAAAIDNAIRDKNWDANVKIGWDPTHVQPVGVAVGDTLPPQNKRIV